MRVRVRAQSIRGAQRTSRGGRRERRADVSAPVGPVAAAEPHRLTGGTAAPAKLFWQPFAILCQSCFVLCYVMLCHVMFMNTVL